MICSPSFARPRVVYVQLAVQTFDSGSSTELRVSVGVRIILDIGSYLRPTKESNES